MWMVGARTGRAAVIARYVRVGYKSAVLPYLVLGARAPTQPGPLRLRPASARRRDPHRLKGEDRLPDDLSRLLRDLLLMSDERKSPGERAVEIVGTVMGVVGFLLMLWLIGALFWDPPITVLDWFF